LAILTQEEDKYIYGEVGLHRVCGSSAFALSPKSPAVTSQLFERYMKCYRGA